MATYSPFDGNVIQIGAEGTSGTALAADVLWRGPAASIEDGSEVVHADETIGLLAPSGRTYIPQKIARLAMPETDATFEQLPHIFEAGILTATPTGASPYAYPYAVPFNTDPAITTYTVETGNKIAYGAESGEMEYSFVESFTLSGRSGEPWKVSANWVGRQFIKSALTTVAVAAVEEMLFQKTIVSVDATGGTIGATALDGVVVDCSIKAEKTGIVAVFTADGELFFVTHKRVMPSYKLTMTLELNSDEDVAAIRTGRDAGSIQLVRVAVAGTASRAAEFDLAVKWDKVGTIQNSDGNTTVQVEGTAVYSSADALYAKFTVSNLLAALP